MLYLLQKQREILDFFKALEFSEGEHLYSVNGKRINSSVSKIIKNFVKPFDAMGISASMAKWQRRPQEDILAEWEETKNIACDKGNRVHLFGELYPFNPQIKPSDGYEKAVVKFWEEVPAFIKPLIMELQMYHKKHLYAGTADILLYNKLDDTYIIGDYKTNKDLFKNHKGQRMTGIFSDLLDTPFNKYQLQLSFYQILFEQMGLKVVGRKIIWVRPDGEYLMYDTNDYTDILREYLENNKV